MTVVTKVTKVTKVTCGDSVGYAEYRGPAEGYSELTGTVVATLRALAGVQPKTDYSGYDVVEKKVRPTEALRKAAEAYKVERDTYWYAFLSREVSAPYDAMIVYKHAKEVIND